MADSILRLRVDSQEYDNKLKRATEQLSRYSDGCRKAGGTLQYVDDNVVEFTRSLGRMETTATTARGKVSELTNAYTELAVRYKNMTDEEKKGEYGKALAASLDELKGRIRETKNDLDDVNKSISGSGGLTGALDAVAGKFGLSIEQLTKFGGVAAIATTAVNVAKDAFFANELTVDEWGRTMEASKSLYEGFLNALNTGDISGYLNNMGQIVKAAREAYNEIDKLGTMQTIQKPLVSAQQTENDRIRQMIMTKRYIAPIDGRSPAVFNGKPMVNGQLLTDGQIKQLERQLQGGINRMINMVGREVKQSNKAIDAVYSRFAKENGMSLGEFRKGTSSWDEFEKRMQGYSDYEKWRSENYYTDNWGNRRVKEGNPYQQYKNWGVFRVDGNRYNDELVNLILQRDQQAASVYGMQSQAYRTINRAEGITSRVGGGRSGGSHSGGGGKGGGNIGEIIEKDDFQEMEELTGLLNIQHQKLSDLQAMKPFAETEDELISLNEQIREANDEYQRLLNLGNEPIEDPFTPVLPPLMQMESILKQLNEDLKNAETPEVYQNILSDIEAVNAEISKFTGNGGVTSLKKAGDDTGKSWREATSSISAVGSALQTIQDPSAKIAGIVGQAVANIALGFAQATAASSGGGIFGWIAAIVGGMATMISTIEAIHNATGYSNGGVVQGPLRGYAVGGTIEGTHYSGDMQLARVNAGETILTRAQAGNLASQLEGGGLQNLNLHTDISGRYLRIILDNDSMSRGNGRFVTSNN